MTLCKYTDGVGVCLKEARHSSGHYFETTMVTVSQSTAGTTVRPRSCVGSGRLYALPTTGTFSDAKANRVWHVSVDDSSGLQSVAYASCPDCGALVQIINDRIPEHYGR